MNKTSNYQLNQWELTDRIRMEDFNGDNEKIDAALAEEKSARAAADAALNAALEKCGNCRIVASSYTGTGGYESGNPCTLTFDSAPVLVLVASTDGHTLFMHSNSTQSSYDGITIFITWNGTSVSWYANGSAKNQFNESGKVYRVFAFFVTEE